MLSLYLDEDVDVLLAVLLESRGYDCLTTVAADRLGSNDEQQLEFSTAEGRILITHNRLDFERLATEWWKLDKPHAGILLLMRRSSPHEQLRGLVRQLEQYSQEGWQDIVVYA